jgi:hypothetical protein
MMADITTTYANILNGLELVTSPCAASQTLKCGRDETEILFVDNTTGGGTLTVTIVAGDGIRSAIGNVNFDVAAGKIFVVGGFDGMRVNNTTGANKGKIVVNCVMGSGGTLANAKLGYVQL